MMLPTQQKCKKRICSWNFSTRD